MEGFTSPVLQAKFLKANPDLEPASPELEGTHKIQFLAPRTHHGHFPPDINPHRHFHELSQERGRVILF